jgi:RNA polymerase-binding transcription factor DksA
MDIENFKQKLLEEKDILTEEINALGVLRVSNENYEAKAETGVDTAEDMALADMFEVEQTKDAVLDQLENRLMDVERALTKMANGVYGICEVSGEQIEEARLEANPAARTNIANRETLLD